MATFSNDGTHTTDIISSSGLSTSTYTQTCVYEGDSITANNGRNWPQQLAKYYPTNFSGLQIDQGLAGDSIQNMVGEYTAQIHPYANTSNSNFFFLLAGTNDWGLNSRTAAQIYADLKTEWAQARADGFKVVALAMIPSTATNYAGGSQAVNPLILSDPSLYDFLIRTDIVLPDSTDATLFLPDHVHPNEAGSKLIADEINRVVGPSMTTTIADTVYIGNGIGIGKSAGEALDVNGNINIGSGNAYKYGGVDALHGLPNIHSWFFGNAGNLTMTGDYNTGGGYLSLYTNSTGQSNTSYGYLSLSLNSTGSYNTALGGAALYNNTNSYNTGVGYLSLTANTSGGSNTALGYNSLTANTTGNYSVGIGAGALAANTTGSNTAVGYTSLSKNTTGLGNTGIGYAALNACITGNYNCALGQGTLYYGTGSDNTGVGYAALGNLTSGADNTAIGYSSGRFIADGTTANATSGTSVYLGTNTRSSANGNANEIVIGYTAIGNGSNTATIGNSSTVGTYLNGIVYLGKTITAIGTTGAQTINKPSGCVNFAASAASLVVTNNLVTVNSVIQCSIGTNDSTMLSCQVVAVAGSFTIYSKGVPTAETRVNFTVTN